MLPYFLCFGVPRGKPTPAGHRERRLVPLLALALGPVGSTLSGEILCSVAQATVLVPLIVLVLAAGDGGTKRRPDPVNDFRILPRQRAGAVPRDNSPFRLLLRASTIPSTALLSTSTRRTQTRLHGTPGRAADTSWRTTSVPRFATKADLDPAAGAGTTGIALTRHLCAVGGLPSGLQAIAPR